MAIVTAMCKLLFCMAIGFFCYKKEYLTLSANSSISKLITMFFNPCLILYSISTVDTGNDRLVLSVLLASFACYAAFIVIGWLFTKLFRIRVGLQGVYMCCIIFANCGFMGMPVAQSLYGDSAIFYVAVFIIPFNLIFYTLGLSLIEKDSSANTGNITKVHFDAKKLINPGSVASLAALLIYFGRLHIPSLFFTCVGFVGNVTMPLSMISIGASLAAASFKDVKGERSLLPMLLFRLAVIPAFTWCFLHLFIKDPIVLNICAITSGMPVGALVAMGSSQWPEQYRVSSMCVAISTLVSIFTVPVMTLLMGA